MAPATSSASPIGVTPLALLATGSSAPLCVAATPPMSRRLRKGRLLICGMKRRGKGGWKGHQWRTSLTLLGLASRGYRVEQLEGLLLRRRDLRDMVLSRPRLSLTSTTSATVGVALLLFGRFLLGT